jgi:dienelactone hydrolase
MITPRHLFTGLTLALVAGCAAVEPPTTGARSPVAVEEDARDAAYNTLPDTPGTGRYAAMKEVLASLPGHVVYRPADLAGLGQRKLGVLLWGNGGCRADGASARLHLLEIASHGYVAIAPGDVRSGPGAVPRVEQPRTGGDGGAFAPVETTPEDLLAALNWILAEDGRAGSPFYGRIDREAVAVAGHSCGGLQAIKVAADPRIATAIIHNSGVLNSGTPNPITGLSVSKDELARLHQPVLYVLGGERDIAHANGTDDFRRIDHVPVALADLDVGHGGTFREPNGGRAAQVAVRWLEWQLRGDTDAAGWFVGTACRLCTSPYWDFQAKGL